MAEHVRVHVALLQLKLEQLDLISAICSDLLALKIASKNVFGSLNFFAGNALILFIAHNPVLIIGKVFLQLDFADGLAKLLSLSSSEEDHLG